MSVHGKTVSVLGQHPKSGKGAWQRTHGGSAGNSLQ